MSDLSPNLALPYMQPSQAQKHVTHNEALERLDVLAQLCLEGFATLTPPSAPAEGEAHGVGAGATGAWAGQDGRIAAWIGGAWMFLAPQTGWRAWGRAEAELRIWDGAAWVPVAGDLNNLAGLGIGTSWDATNRLAVTSDAALFTHAGSGHQVKINKAGISDTASLLYQTNWSGRAEMGLAGTDDFAVKVSADGASWTEALSFDAATGGGHFPQGLEVSGTLSGTAVTQSTTDTGPGRLTKVGDFGLGAANNMPVAADADTLIVTGMWTVTSGTANIPVSTTGVLLVWRSYNVVMQRFFRNQVAYARRSTDTGATWTSWQVVETDILGTVSQSGGVITGDLIERGSGVNGDYLRLADGTQICTREAQVDVTSTSSQGFTMAASFAATTAMFVSHLSGTPNAALELDNIRALNPSLSSFWVRLRTAGTSSDPTSAAEKLILTAIGRWF